MSVTIDDIKAAAKTIDGEVVKTPCTRSHKLSEITGAELVLKFENLQYTGSFKDRGSLVKLKSLTPDESAAGVIAMSAGNHAQAVAYHATRLGIASTIVMPEGTPQVKAQNTHRLGARVVFEGETIDEAAVRARAMAADEGITFVHPYDDPKIVAGQGTVALEMLADFPDLDILVVPIGGGGLISGNAIAAKAINPDIEIIGVEAALYPSMYQAVNGLTPKTVAEGAGAATLAALLAHPERFAGRRVGAIISGGNIDMRLLSSVILRGLVRDGRIVRMRIEITDSPGTLARIAKVIGDTDGNIIEVYHQRAFSGLPAKNADLDVVIETRDAEHVRDIMARLTAIGFRCTLLGSDAVMSPM